MQYGIDKSEERREEFQIYLTECMYQFVLESQLPHKMINLLFTITN